MPQPTDFKNLKENLLSIQTQLQNQTWVKKQDPKFIKALNNIDNAFADLTTHLYMMISYFEQYVEAVQSSDLFAPLVEKDKNDNEYSSPTQTFSASAEEVAP